MASNTARATSSGVGVGAAVLVAFAFVPAMLGSSRLVPLVADHVLPTAQVQRHRWSRQAPDSGLPGRCRRRGAWARTRARARARGSLHHGLGGGQHPSAATVRTAMMTPR